MTASLLVGLVSVLGVAAAPEPIEVRIDPHALMPHGRSSRSLFEVTTATLPALDARQRDVNASPQTRVVCGMTVIDADPRVDPKMRVQPPQEGIEFAIRRAKPSICVD